MSKLGRYAAQRIKIEALVAASTKTCTVADCGTVFTLPGGNGVGAITLPSIADAGAGWWCKFILLADNGTGAIVISAASGDEDTIVASNYGGLGDDTNSANVSSDAEADAVNFVASKALAGDSVEFICTGDEWISQNFSADGDAGMTLSS